MNAKEYLDSLGISSKIERGINAAVKWRSADPHAVIAASLLTASPLHKSVPGLRALLLEPTETWRKSMGKRPPAPAEWLKSALEDLRTGLDPFRPGTASSFSGRRPATAKTLAVLGVESVKQWVEQHEVNEAAAACMNDLIKRRPPDAHAFAAAAFAARSELHKVVPAFTATLKQVALSDSLPEPAAVVAQFIEGVYPASKPDPPAAAAPVETGAAPVATAPEADAQ
eukprot:5609711-Prymnesium_polylepis.1